MCPKNLTFPKVERDQWCPRLVVVVSCLLISIQDFDWFTPVNIKSDWQIEKTKQKITSTKRGDRWSRSAFGKVGFLEHICVKNTSHLVTIKINQSTQIETHKNRSLGKYLREKEDLDHRTRTNKGRSFCSKEIRLQKIQWNVPILDNILSAVTIQERILSARAR